MTKQLSRRTVLAACAGILGIGAILHFNSAPPRQSGAGVPPVAITAASAETQDIPLQIQAVATSTGILVQARAQDAPALGFCLLITLFAAPVRPAFNTTSFPIPGHCGAQETYTHQKKAKISRSAPYLSIMALSTVGKLVSDPEQ